MRRILIDVNVILDVLLNRSPHADNASEVWSAVETGRAQGFISAHAITTIHYLNTKAVGRKMAAETTEALLSVFDVAIVDEGVLRKAAAAGWPDFEDAVTAAAAASARCDAIVTRNPRDFSKSSLRVITPALAAAALGNAG